MTSTTLDVSRREPATAVVLGRALRAESARIWSVRSTWVLVLVVAVAMLGLATLLSFDAREELALDPPAEAIWAGVRFTGMPGLFLLLALAAVTATADHATGGIVPTLQWTPRRGILFAARAVTVIATTAACGLGLALGAGLIIRLVVPSLAVPLGDGLGVLGGFALVFVCGAALAVGLGLFLRNTAGALVSAYALMVVLPILLGNFPYPWAQDLARLLPGMSAVDLLVGDGPEDLSVATARLTLCLWAAGALALGGWRLVRSDANR